MISRLALRGPVHIGDDNTMHIGDDNTMHRESVVDFDSMTQCARKMRRFAAAEGLCVHVSQDERSIIVRRVAGHPVRLVVAVLCSRRHRQQVLTSDGLLCFSTRRGQA